MSTRKGYPSSPWIARFVVFLCTPSKCLQNLENNFSTSLDSSFDSCPHISDENSKIGFTRELNVSSSV